MFRPVFRFIELPPIAGVTSRLPTRLKLSLRLNFAT